MGTKLTNRTIPKGEKAPPGHKWCPKCLRWQPKEIFYKNRASGDGLSSYCRPHYLEVKIVQRHKIQKKKREEREARIKAAME